VSDCALQVSVVVVTHDSLPVADSCWKALHPALEGLTYELIIIDNASRDDSPNTAAALFPTAIIERNERNLGFAAACNQGATKATGEWLLFVNPDVTVDPGAIKALLTTVQARPDAGLVSGRLRWPDGSFQPTCRRFPTPVNMVFSRQSALAKVFGGGVGRGTYTLPDFDEVTEVPAVAGTFVMIARERFRKTGGFDERFYMYMEDTDLSLRLHQGGYPNLFVPQAGAVHDWGHGGSAGRLKRLRWHHVSAWKYFLKNFPNGFSVLVLPVLLLVNFVVAAVFAKPAGREPR